MKRVFLLTLVIAALVTATAAVAADTLKIGFIDLDKVILESEAGKKAWADLEAFLKTKQVVIDEKGEAIKKVEVELSKQLSVLSPEVIKQKEDELDKLKIDHQRLFTDSQTEFQKKRGQLIDAILEDLTEVVIKFAKDEGYTIILPIKMLLYAKEELDLTDVIIKKFNESKEKTKEEPKEKPKGKK